jgi:hypothetical protein
MRRDGGNKPQFPIIRKRNFARGEPTTQIGLNRLNKFQFTRRRFGNKKSRCQKRSSEKSNRFCPSGESATRSERSRKSSLRGVTPLLCPNLLPLSAARGHGRACPTPSRMARPELAPASSKIEHLARCRLTSLLFATKLRYVEHRSL